MEYFLMTEEQRTGPFTEEEVHARVRAGGVNARTLVWHKGLDKWRPFSDVFAEPPEPVYWFAMIDNRHAGPMTPQVFWSQVAAGQITPETPVWRAGMTSWQPLGETAETPPSLSSPRPCPQAKQAPALSRGASARFDGIAPPFKYGGFWIRLLAIILDTVLLWAILMFVLVVLDALLIGTAKMTAGPSPSQEAIVAFFALGMLGMIGIFLALLVTAFLYPVLTTWWLGGTLGKLICGLRVVGSDGEVLSLLRCTARELAKGIISNSLTAGIGFLVAAFTAEKTALHDLICNTRVVRKR